MEFVLARAGYSARRRCFLIMLLRDHEKAPILSARQKIGLGPGRLVGLLHIVRSRSGRFSSATASRAGRRRRARRSSARRGPSRAPNSRKSALAHAPR
jgi:hypothetical protein